MVSAVTEDDTAAAELTVALNEKDYWSEFGDTFGWRLYGWTDRSVAYFIIPGSSHTAEITGRMRDDIMAVLARRLTEGK